MNVKNRKTIRNNNKTHQTVLWKKEKIRNSAQQLLTQFMQRSRYNTFIIPISPFCYAQCFLPEGNLCLISARMFVCLIMEMPHSCCYCSRWFSYLNPPSHAIQILFFFSFPICPSVNSICRNTQLVQCGRFLNSDLKLFHTSCNFQNKLVKAWHVAKVDFYTCM